jgi:hypothetical protein
LTGVNAGRALTYLGAISSADKADAEKLPQDLKRG